jgi:ABC-2 type transport system permease protein
MGAALIGARRLTWVAIRRDRVQLPVWLIGLSALVTLMAFAMGNLFASEQELRAATRTFAAAPVFRAFGLASGASIGAFVMLRGFTTLAVLTALMSALIVVRHTRQNEETGRADLIGSGVVGRHASLAAGLGVALAANGVLAALVTAGLTVAGLGTSGALAAGLALGGVGLAFAGVAAVAAQVSESGRGATGMTAGAIGAAFAVAAVANLLGTVRPSGVEVESEWLTWLSPIGWGQQVRPFGGNHLWILGLFATWFVAFAVIAVYLERRRDVGRGMIPERRGPARAPAGLLSPIGLAWRLQRGTLLGWAVGAAAFGAVFGGITREVEELLTNVEQGADLFMQLGGTSDLIAAYWTGLFGIIGAVSAVYAVQALLRLRSEETDGPLELLLATAVSRLRWMLAQVTVAAVGIAAILVVTGVSAGIAAAVTIGDLGQMTAPLQAAVVQVPATFVVGGIVIASFGIVPRLATPVAWAGFLVALVAGPLLGTLLDLPSWALNASPFTHLPAAPAAAIEPLPLVVLGAIALGLAGAGAATFSRRNLAL